MKHVHILLAIKMQDIVAEIAEVFALLLHCSWNGTQISVNVKADTAVHMPRCLPIRIAAPNLEIDAIDPLVKYRQMQNIADAELFIAIIFGRYQPLDPHTCTAITIVLQLRKICHRDAFVRRRTSLACVVYSLIMNGGACGTRPVHLADGVEARGRVLAIPLIQQFIPSEFICNECPGGNGGLIHRTIIGKSVILLDEAQVDAVDCSPFFVESTLSCIVQGHLHRLLRRFIQSVSFPESHRSDWSVPIVAIERQ